MHWNKPRQSATAVKESGGETGEEERCFRATQASTIVHWDLGEEEELSHAEEALYAVRLPRAKVRGRVEYRQLGGEQLASARSPHRSRAAAV